MPLRGSRSRFFWATLDRYPPILLRLLAKASHSKPLSSLDISELSGLSPVRVDALSQTLSWDDVPLSEFKAFQIGCKIDLNNPNQLRRVQTYTNGKMCYGHRRPPSFLYLRAHPEWKSYYLPLLQRWLKSVESKM